MLQIRKASERGHADFGWLDSRHTFSFGQYYDPAHMGFGPLRVINDDRIAGGGGFPMHPHADMEIVTYVLNGALAHKDSLGTGSVIQPGDVQKMTAGTGIRHSEFNASATDPVHLLQIWLLPDRRGRTPSYEQKTFAGAERRGRLRLVGSRDGREDTLTLHTDAEMYAAILAPGDTVAHRVEAGRSAWIQVARGSVSVNGAALASGDGASVTEPGRLDVTGTEDAEILVFDLAA